MFRALFETAPDAMIVVDRGGCIVLANPQAGQLFGYTPEELLGQPIEILLPEGARGAHRGHRDRYMGQPRVRPMGAGQELTGRRGDGTTFPVEIALSPIESDEGPRFVASIRDISETQRARQALVRARHDAFAAQIGQLALEAPTIDVLAEGLPELVAAALRIDAVALLLSYGQRADLGVRASIGLEPALLAALPRRVSRHGFEGQGRSAESRPEPVEDFAAAAMAGEGEAFVAAGFRSGALVRLFDLDQPMGVLVALAREPHRFDRDALHFLQSAANLAAAAAQRDRVREQLSHSQRLDAVGQLTGGIAHDFNNLLTVISGNLQLLETQVPEQGEAQEIIGTALRAVGRGAELTRKLLAFARRQRLTPRQNDPSQILRELGEMLGRTLSEYVAVEIACPADVAHVYADSSQLEAALLNLALNSRDAMPRGGRLRFEVRVEHVDADSPRGDLGSGDYVVFSVVDTGIGMTPEVLARALEPFFTTKDSGKGSGLGLSMVYGFVKQSGGHLTIESQLGYGTRIELFLPATAAGAAIEKVPITARRVHSQEAILVVEDEPEVRGIAVAFLRSLGYVPQAASDAEEALRVLAAHPEIVLMFSDVVLGSGSNGYELAREARRARPDLRVLLTSGYESTLLGTDDATTENLELVRKPYRREELAAAVRRTLDRA